MNVVDSSGWLEFLADGPNAQFFARPLEAVGDLVVPTISLFEVFKRVLVQRGEEAALQAAALMHQGLLAPLSAPISIAAARMSVELELPLADSVILATAREHGATLWTQDADFADLPGVKFVSRKGA